MNVILTSAIEQGLLYCFMVLGVYLTFRVLDFPDLTVDGSLTMGAATTATLIVQGVSPFMATVVGVVAGMGAGCVTGMLHLLLKSGASDTNYGPKLLAGILTMTGLYTVNLRIMGRSNVPLLGVQVVYDKIGAFLSLTLTSWNLILALAALTLIVKFLLDSFLHTEFGLSLQATGDNEQMIRAMGANTDLTRIIGLGLANALVALSGALVAQQQGFADIGMGIGSLVAGLASVIMGEVIFGMRSVSWVLFSVIGGSIVYRALIAVSLRFGVNPTDLKLLTAALVVIALSAPTIRKKVMRT